ncbi:MAG: glycosyltransferase [Marinilabiliaceae bacterium]|nr:glycosyltransferase [Marinilabiliaceae bacterium]
MYKRIVFFGALPQKDESKTGGGEWGNLRTVKMLRQFGYDVVTIRKTSVKPTCSRLFIYLTVPFRTICDIVKTIFCTLNVKNVVFHYSGFAWKTILLEYIIIRVAKFWGCHLIYEIRGGGLLKTYAESGNGYKNKLKYILNHSDYVFSQGQENIPLITKLSEVPVYHYANCISADFYPSKLPAKPLEIINLIYFGRISPDKNLSLIVDAARILQQSGWKISLTIIGNGQDKAYVSRIHNEIHNKLNKNSYLIIPGCTHEKLKDFLIDKHFYIFPSQVVLEGQSNSVTEAMSYGIIPIASPQGFNRSTIGDDRLIIDKFDAADYAKRINEIIDNNEFDSYSNYVYKRFLDNYTEEVVFEKTKVIYKSIFDHFVENG